MATKDFLNVTQHTKIYEFFKQDHRVYARSADKIYRIIEAIFWMARSGAQWRLLPEHYGKWNSVYKRFSAWSEAGVFTRMHAHFANDPDFESIMIDATVVRAHACAAGAPKQKGVPERQSLGRSKGGFSTKIHAVVDALGNPLEFTITEGNRHDVTQSRILVAPFDATYVMADKAYDAQKFIETLLEKGIIPVIPNRANRIEKREVDAHLYKERHLVECLIGKMKHFRRIFSRFDKLGKRFMSFLQFVATIIWLR